VAARSSLAGPAGTDKRRPLAWSAIVLSVVAFVLAFWGVQEVRVQDVLQQTAAVREGEILSSLVQQAYEENDVLTARILALRTRLGAAGRGAEDMTQLTALLARTRTVAGLTPASGPGVVVTLQDSTSPRYPGEPAEFELVHDQYVLHIVGLLEGVGASAVFINGQRYVGTTSVFCAGPTIRVNGINEGSPFVIAAIGPVGRMLTALATDPDVQGWAQLVQLHYRAAASLRAPALANPPIFRYARPLTTLSLGGSP
jgi:uncharacterized protein YlxW (UPF0749 family)